MLFVRDNVHRYKFVECGLIFVLASLLQACLASARAKKAGSRQQLSVGALSR
jgi:hypothetical protein